MHVTEKIAMHNLLGEMEDITRRYEGHIPLGVRDALNNVLDVIDKEAWS